MKISLGWETEASKKCKIVSSLISKNQFHLNKNKIHKEQTKLTLEFRMISLYIV